MNGPLKNEKSRQILPKSQNLAQPTNGSQSLSHNTFSSRALILKCQSQHLDEFQIYYSPPLREMPIISKFLSCTLVLVISYTEQCSVNVCCYMFGKGRLMFRW